MEKQGFGRDFVWGVATSALQVEGSLASEGRGESVWDQKCLDAGPGDDSYRKIQEDITLLKTLGVKAYRFSVSWSRIFPDGIGKTNEKGCQYYKNLAIALKQNGIEPYVTLFHWDYPMGLEKLRGWLSEESPYWFLEYAKAVGSLLNGLVSHYFLINEPQCFLGMGHYDGSVPPYHRYRGNEYLLSLHHVLFGCGLAEKALRSVSSIPLSIGMALTYNPPYPKDPSSPSDILAAKEASLSPRFSQGAFCLPLYADPAFLGQYPSEWLKALQSDFAPKASEMAIVKAHYDFFGINIYTGVPMTGDGGERKAVSSSVDKTAIGWEIHPDSLYYPPRFLFERYHLPIIISENGLATADRFVDGKIHDAERIVFLKKYIMSLKKGIEDFKTPILGYFCWSFLDNFEWNLAYGPRFGLVYVDYSHDAKRYPKDSFDFFRSLIKDPDSSLL